ncbi:MAG: hypothetical protein ABRQ38_10515 [Candidatus Eremiobacterota bacterium]
MTQKEILLELKNFTNEERLKIIEDTLNMIREDIRRADIIKNQKDKKNKLAEAARVMLKDYATDKELTAFTALDGEDFYD